MGVGNQADQRQSVLFVCRFNAVRSQMAEAMLRDRYGDRYDACSAGLYPAGLDPWAVAVMAESGIDMAHQTSKLLDIFMERRFDTVVILSDSIQDIIPLPDAGRYLRVPLPDPIGTAEDRTAAFVQYRRIRDQLDGMIEEIFAPGR